MAQKVQVSLVDDIDGTEAQQTVTFSLDGTEYEIDLSDSNAGEFRKALDRYRRAARKTGRNTQARVGNGNRGSTKQPRRDLPLVRAWARDNGYEVSARGRISTEIIEAFDRRNERSPQLVHSA